jgi:hypothetical protein
MPGGICASTLMDLDFKPAARCGLLGIRMLGLPMQVSLGGFAEAYFPERSNEMLASLAPDDIFRVVWDRAVFHGKHWLLGSITARLAASQQALDALSTVTGGQALGGQAFFPAVNRNYFAFEVAIPRFGLRLRSVEPIVNSAAITAIPPYGAIYQLEKPVRFQPVSGGLIRVLSATIEQCSIKLVELSHIRASLSELSAGRVETVFEISLWNDTSESDIQLAWLVWPDDELEAVNGVLNLNRTEARIRVAVPTPALRTQRWFAVAIAQPFHTEAAQIVRFPLGPA